MVCMLKEIFTIFAPLSMRLQKTVLLNSIQEKCEGLGGKRAVVAQWLEHWWLKPVALHSFPGDNQEFSSFSFAFFPDPFR